MTKTKNAGGSNLRQKRVHPFSIDYKSAVDDRNYRGKFICKKLAIRDLASLGVRKSQLNGGMYHDAANPGYGVDEQTDEFNNMVAHLDLAIVESPEWWDLDEVTDVGLLAVVYREVIAFENKFLGRGGGEDSGSSGDAGGSSEGGSSADASEAGSPGDVAEVVDSEVQSALEP